MTATKQRAEVRRAQVWQPRATSRSNRRLTVTRVTDETVRALSYPEHGPGNCVGVSVPKDRMHAEYRLIEEAPHVA